MSKADQVKAEMEADAEEPLSEQFNAAQTGPHHYTVRSNRNDDPRAHRVNVRTVQCSCEDMTYNKSNDTLTPTAEEGAEICDHLAFVLELHPQLTAEEMALYESMGLRRQAENLRDRLDMQLDRFQEVLADLQLAEKADTADVENTATDDDSSATEQSSEPSGPSAEDQAGVLQSAFDDVLDDMQVQASGGHVWFKTGYDTEEKWPFPGGEETFQVITSPDAVKYVHDGSADWADSPHPLNDEKPGEYWKNALAPEDVDAYISEVLQ